MVEQVLGFERTLLGIQETRSGSQRQSLSKFRSDIIQGTERNTCGSDRRPGELMKLQGKQHHKSRLQ